MALPITLCHIVLYKPYGILESESEQLVLNIQARSQHLFAQSQENNSCPLQREDWGRGGGRSEWFSHTAKAT